MSIGHVVTVGTSLVMNTGYGGDPPASDRARDKWCEELNDWSRRLRDARRPNRSHVNDANNARRRLSEGLRRAEKADLEREFGFRSADDDGRIDRLPQELSYLYAVASERNFEGATEPVRLLCSDTDLSKDCAEVLTAVLGDEPWNAWFKVEFDRGEHFAEAVNADDGDAFEQAGMNNWMTKIRELVEDLVRNGCTEVHVNVTGGYKGTVPYSTLMGMFMPCVRLVYLFETSPKILSLPSYPIGVDFRLWHENAICLRRSKGPASEAVFFPDEKVRNLLTWADDSWKLSTFGELLEKQYISAREEDPLKVYSRRIVSRFLGGEDNDEKLALRTILLDLVDRSGDMIWLGDKIPEMVDHSLRHHHDLLEFAELFLRPILAVDPNFLNSCERFVLLAAILLHDCGHSLDRLSVKGCQSAAGIMGSMKPIDGLPDEIPLFPSEVRDYHQYLAVLRLNDEKLAGELGWPGPEGLTAAGLPKDLHDAVATACLYHRRRMGYDKPTNEKHKLHLTGQLPPQLCGSAAASNAQAAEVNLKKVVALLRVIDGCDSQASRAGPLPRLNLALELLDRDAETARMRAQRAVDALREFDSNGTLATSLPHPVAADARLSDATFQKHHACCEVAARATGTAQQARLWLAAAEAVDTAAIRSRQFYHYMKHVLVERVDVLGRASQNGGWDFEVVLHQRDETEQIQKPRGATLTVKEVLAEDSPESQPGERQSMKQWIEKELCGEYVSVKDYMNDALHMRLSYRWKDGDAFYPPRS